MATCPTCHVSSRTDPTALSLEPVLQADPILSYSLAGVQTKVNAHAAWRITCRCGWTVTGQIEDGHLVVTPNPTTEGGPS